MTTIKRPLQLDICDCDENILCQLYDSGTDVSGQAYEVYISTQRNGWRELSFSLPEFCYTVDGEEHNYRLDYIKAGYKIRSIEPDDTQPNGCYQDWFNISGPRITHNGYNKTVDVTAGHVSQVLKYKNLNLQFSDTLGDNTGTAKELLQYILDGTGWSVGYVYSFKEKNSQKDKVRSLVAGSKTGAFKLITKLCQLFQAKPVFNGGYKMINGQYVKRTVDLLPINPFSQPQPGKLPQIQQEYNVIQLAYGNNVKNVTRTLNTDNMATRLYAYGSYGDYVKGYCGIDIALHEQLYITLTQTLNSGGTYYFNAATKRNQHQYYYFTPDRNVNEGSVLIFSKYDAASKMYIWDTSYETTEDEAYNKAFVVRSGKHGSPLSASIDIQKIKNWMTSVMDFTYYLNNDMLSDEKIKQIAAYQRYVMQNSEQIYNKSIQLTNSLTDLALSIGSIDFCKLDFVRKQTRQTQLNDENGNPIQETYYVDDDVSEYVSDNSYDVLVLKDDEYEDGVIYRTDYAQKKKNRFKFVDAVSNIPADSNPFDTHGNPINAATSIVYIIHSDTSYDTAYLRQQDELNGRKVLILNAAKDSLRIAPNDEAFIFKYNGINGYLGALQVQDEAAKQAIDDLTTIATVQHPVFYYTPDLNINPPSVQQISSGYGWLWKYYLQKELTERYLSDMFFCYKERGDQDWYPVYFSNTQPTGSISDNAYWFNWHTSVLHVYKGQAWVKLDTDSDNMVARQFGSVYASCKTRDKVRQGVYDKYVYTHSGSELPAGNYYFENDYDTYWAFTTKQELKAGDTLTYGTKDRWVSVNKSGVETSIKSKDYKFDSVFYHPQNLLENVVYEEGTIGTGVQNGGIFIDQSGQYRTASFIPVYPGIRYELIGGALSQCIIHKYDENKRWIVADKQSNGGFDTYPIENKNKCAYVRITRQTAPQDGQILRSVNYMDTIVIKDETYTKLQPITGMNNKSDIAYPFKGILAQIKQFRELADASYLTIMPQLKALQDEMLVKQKAMTDALGDIYKESYWQKDDYVEGDEQKLYEDALDNLQKIAKPQAQYNVSFLDLFGQDIMSINEYVSEQTGISYWPDLKITTAIHLIDEQIDLSIWAYVDKLKKCYDAPHKTTLTINTNLTTMTQHSFSDVISKIADVANYAKGKAAQSTAAPQYVDGQTIAQGSIKGDQIQNSSIPVSKLSDFEQAVNRIVDQRVQDGGFGLGTQNVQFSYPDDGGMMLQIKNAVKDLNTSFSFEDEKLVISRRGGDGKVFSIEISPTKMSFYDDNHQQVAYFSQNTLFVNNTVAQQSMRLGDLIGQVQDDGSVEWLKMTKG